MSTDAGSPRAGNRTVRVRRLKHEQVADELAEAIRDGRLSPGDRLLGEHELARGFAVSRGTMRRALDDLSGRNLITTRCGLGSFVTFDGHEIDDTVGWGRSLMASGVEVLTQTLRLAVVVDADLARQHGTPGHRFLAVDRARRLTDGTVVSIERSRVPAVGGLLDVPEKGLTHGSLMTTLRDVGLVPANGEQWVQVAPLTDDDAALLGRPAGTPYLHTVRISRDARGALVETVDSLLDPDRFRLHLSF